MPRVLDLNKFYRGWLVGCFEPSLVKTNDVEVALKTYEANDTEALHHHKIADEYTIILSGRVKMNGQLFSEGQIVHVKPSEATDFLALENTTTLVIKSPSVTKDKYDGECDGD